MKAREPIITNTRKNKMKIGFLFYCKNYYCVIRLVYLDHNYTSVAEQ